MLPRAPDGLAPLAEALAADPDEIEARVRQLGGDPPGLGELGGRPLEASTSALGVAMLGPPRTWPSRLSPPTRDELRCS